jgi:hypothetical protein
MSQLKFFNLNANAVTLDGISSFSAHFIDKHNWSDGQWLNEPDLFIWVDPASQMPCIIIRDADFGHLKAYIGVQASKELGGLTSLPLPQEINWKTAYLNIPDAVPGLNEAINSGQWWWAGFHGMGIDDTLPWIERPGINFPDSIVHTFKRSVCNQREGATYKDLDHFQRSCSRLALEIFLELNKGQ